ncbi:MAG: hypothetical protein HYX29_02600 [Solirubrobacterales bacterium]|nr:hypothetical protein [Solirubrobacterales bacterium]
MFTSLRFRTLLLALIIVGTASFASSAAASVAYIDANEVWVSSDDGSRKVRLSAGEGDWREVAQSDQGYILATRRESGKISQLASFTIWDPTGKLIHFGSLSGDIDGSGSNVYPLSLDITPSGGNFVYGYSRYRSGPPSSLVKGIYLKVSSDASTGVPLSLTSGEYPTLVGTRIVARLGSSTVGVQDPSSIGSDTFNPWISYNTSLPQLSGLEVNRTDVSATGLISAAEMMDSSFNTAKIIVGKWSAFAGDYLTTLVDDCFLPSAGAPRDISVSQDGSTLTWRDSRGVVVAGAPDFSGPSDCTLTRAPSVISATGIYPSYGPFNVPAAAAPVTSKPKVTVGKTIKLNSLKSGLKIAITSAVAGKAKVTLTIKPSKVGKKGKKLITLASGSASVAAGVPKKIKLKFTSAGKKLKRKLKGKKATLTVTVGGQKTTKTVKLK